MVVIELKSLIYPKEKRKISFEFFPSIRDKELPYKGCFRSHAKIISDTYKHGINRLFQDDACSVKKISQEHIDEIRISAYYNYNNYYETTLTFGFLE